MTRTTTALALTGILFLLVGCPEADDPADDDTTGDDDTGDDDTGDDDADEGWISILEELDHRGDAGAHPGDIRDYQYRYDGQTLELRLTSYFEFDDEDPDLGFAMCYETHGGDRGCLHYDFLFGDRLWCGTRSTGGVPLDCPSLFHEDDGPSSIVLGFNPADLGFGLECRFAGEAVLYSESAQEYLDWAPDGGPVDFEFGDRPFLDFSTWTPDDSSGGDGNGQIDPGETVDLALELTNRGCGPSGGGLTAQASIDPLSTASALMTTAATTLAGGAAVDAGDPAPGDSPLQLQIDPGAVAGQDLLFHLKIMDDAGHVWTVSLPRQVLSYPQVAPETLLLEDAVNNMGPLDIASVSYEVTGTELIFRIDSHNELTDCPADTFLFLEVPAVDHLDQFVLFPYETSTGELAGTLYHEVIAGSTEFFPIADLSTFECPGDGNYLRLGTELDRLGSPEGLYFYVVTEGTADPLYVNGPWWQYAEDYAPDGVEDGGPLARVLLGRGPFLEPSHFWLTEVSGDGDPFVDDGEVWDWDVRLDNLGAGPAQTVTMEWSDDSPHVTLPSWAQPFDPIGPGETGWSTAPVTFQVGPGATEGEEISFVGLETANGVQTYHEDRGMPGVVIGGSVGDHTGGATVAAAGGTVMDFTDSADNAYDAPACAGGVAAARDHVVAFLLTEGQQLTAELSYYPGGPDAVLYISDDPDAPDLNCLAGADLGQDETETLVFDVPADGVYYLVVDGVEVDAGWPYTLTVTSP